MYFIHQGVNVIKENHSNNDMTVVVDMIGSSIQTAVYTYNDLFEAGII